MHSMQPVKSKLGEYLKKKTTKTCREAIAINMRWNFLTLTYLIHK